MPNRTTQVEEISGPIAGALVSPGGETGVPACRDAQVRHHLPPVAVVAPPRRPRRARAAAARRRDRRPLPRLRAGERTTRGRRPADTRPAPDVGRPAPGGRRLGRRTALVSHELFAQAIGRPGRHRPRAAGRGRGRGPRGRHQPRPRPAAAVGLAAERQAGPDRDAARVLGARARRPRRPLLDLPGRAGAAGPVDQGLPARAPPPAGAAARRRAPRPDLAAGVRADGRRPGGPHPRPRPRQRVAGTGRGRADATGPRRRARGAPGARRTPDRDQLVHPAGPGAGRDRRRRSCCRPTSTRGPSSAAPRWSRRCANGTSTWWATWPTWCPDPTPPTGRTPDDVTEAEVAEVAVPALARMLLHELDRRRSNRGRRQ